MYHPRRLHPLLPPKWSRREWWQDSRVIAYWTLMTGCPRIQHATWWRIA